MEDYVYEESMEVLPGIYNDIKQILSQLQNKEYKNT